MNSNKQMIHKPAYDIQLLFPVLFLVGIGIVMVYSASSAVALKKFGSSYLFLKKQALFALIGIVGLVICRHFPYRWYRPLAYPLLAVALLLLIAIQLTDFGFSAGGAARWLRFGPFSFQPSELTKLALVIFLAAMRMLFSGKTAARATSKNIKGHILGGCAIGVLVGLMGGLLGIGWGCVA